MPSENPAPQPVFQKALFFSPLIAAAIVILCINAYVISSLIALPFIRDPWEGGIMAEAWRAASGQPVYENPDTGHATHLYGALWSYVLAIPIHLFGFSFEWGRWISFACFLALTFFLARLASGRNANGYLAFCWACLFGLSFQIAHYSINVRPDMAAYLAMAAGIWCCARGLEGRIVAMVTGCLCITVAFFLKQTAAAGALVPLVAVFLAEPRGSWKRLALAALPLATVAAAFVGIRWFAPWVQYYMVGAIGSYSFRKAELIAGLYSLATAVPVFLATVIAGAVGRCYPREAADRWLFASLLVFFPVSLLSRAKIGGDVNSYYPALACMLVLALRMARGIYEKLAGQTTPAITFLVSCAGALLIVQSVLGDVNTNLAYARYRHGDNQYAKLADLIRNLPGKVVSPDDPSLLLMAGRSPGRCAMFEAEINVKEGRYGAIPPPRVMNEIRSADFVVRTRGTYVELISDADLSSAGFVSLDVPALRGSAYQIWRRATPR